MKIKNCLILCGGEGTRIKNFMPGVHKCLIPINGIPFIQYLIEKFKDFTITLCVCKQKDQFYNSYQNNKKIKFSEEESPLGTGGAIINAVSVIHDEYIMITNGDSYCDFDLDAFMTHFRKTKHDLYIVATQNYSNILDYGMIETNNNHKILSFTEKPNKTNGKFYQNCGIYIIKKRLLEEYPNEKKSFETEMLPKLVKKNKCYIFQTDMKVYDIGTKNRIVIATEYFKLKN